MGFWIFMLAADLLIPLVMLGFGSYFLKKAPKKINVVFGYRTRMSMKNQDTWDFAHKYCGRLWLIWGLILLPLTVVPMLFVLGKPVGLVAAAGGIICGLQLLVMLLSILPTERALKQTFDEQGHRRI